MLKKIVNKIRYWFALINTKQFIQYLREKGVVIGENVKFNNIKSTTIDLTRPTLITIGDNVYIHKNFSLYTHDFVSGVFLNLYNDFLPSSGHVIIGSNVRFGINCTVLKGTKIGDNCFIAAGSVVTKDIPANSIAGGVPAKVICTIEEYYNKRKVKCVEEAYEYARSIKERLGRDPLPKDFWEEFPLFVNSNNVSEYNEIPIKKQLGVHYEQWLSNHKSQYNGIDDFLNQI